MSKRQTLIVLGVIMVSFLYLGFPEYMDKIIALVAGMVIIFISYKLTPEIIKEKKFTFVEQKNEGVQKEGEAPISCEFIVENNINSSEEKTS